MPVLRIIRPISFMLLLFGVCNASFGQSYDLDIKDVESGMVGNRIHDIAQDADGLIWIATENGVSVFDGINFKNYTQKQGLGKGICTSLLIDDEGAVWVGHQSSGVSRIVGDTIYRYTEEDGLANNEVNQLLQDQDGKIWIATFGGLSVFDDSQWETITAENGLIFNNTHAVAQHPDGSIWAGSYGAGISVINGQTVSHLHMGNGLVNNYVTDLLVQGDEMLIGTLGGLSVWNGRKFASINNSNRIPSQQVNALAYDDQDRLWMATYHGAARVSDRTWQVITEQNGLPQNEVLDVFVDVEGNIWLGTAAGLVRIKDLAFTHYTSTDDIDVYPTSFLVDSDKSLFAGNEAGGVLEFDGEAFVRAFDDPDINNHQISAVTEDADGNIWFGTMDFGGLFQWDGNRFYIYSDEFGLADNNINCLTTNTDGLVFIGTPNGLSTFDGSDFEVVYISDDFSSNNITALASLENGNVVIGSQNGDVHLYQEGEVSMIESVSSESSITDICAHGNGFCIASSDNGIWVVEDGNTTHLTSKQGLPSDDVRIVFQSGNRLFAGCKQQLVQVRLSEDTVTFRHFTPKNGYPGGMPINGAVVNYDGAHFIGTDIGIIRFDPSELNLNNQQPVTQINSLKLAYENVDWTEKGFELDERGLPVNLSLTYTENTVSFQFRGVNHHNPEGVRYNWRLEGLEQNWTPFTHQNYVNYPSLAPGKYTFKLIACNDNGICNTQEEVFQFEITPPFWQRLSFHISVALFVVIVTYLLIRRREQILIKEKEILEATVQERTKELREQKEIVEQQHHHIKEGIEYASNIQRAVLPSEPEMNRAFEKHFIFYRPKDAVGGDFYWVYTKGDISWAAAVDCTGHGVAGAFMSMIGSDLLNQIIIEKQVDDPAKVLDEMDKGIKLAFAQSAEEFESDQGMDMALIRLDKRTNTLEFAGAQRPLFVTHKGDLKEFDGDRFSISCAEQRNADSFAKTTVQLEKGSRIFMFSDGIVDQFGGPKGKKLMIKRLREFLVETCKLPISDQQSELTKMFDNWQGDDNEQVDDVMLLAFQI